MTGDEILEVVLPESAVAKMYIDYNQWREIMEKSEINGDPAFKSNRQAFLRLHDTHLDEYRDKYVAIVNDKVVDFDTDDRVLRTRVHERFPNQPAYFGLVTDKPRRVYFMQIARQCV